MALVVSFQWKNPDFLLKNPDFPLKNPDFLLKTVDFIIKQFIGLIPVRKNDELCIQNEDLCI